MATKLFIPGPTEVAPEVLAAMSGPMTGVPVDEDEMIRDCLVRER